MKNNQKKELSFKNKKVLLMGLGILGGGLNIANWLIEKKAKLTITDLKSRKDLKNSIKKLKNKDIKFVLGKHNEKDFIENDIIVLNQDIQLNNKYLKIAEKNKKQIEDELTLFCKFSPTKNIIAVSGTRGKTTTTNWITHFLKSKFDIVNLGNSPENSLIGKMNQLKKKGLVVVECPSCLLEQSFRVKFAPKIAVITNIYQDHLNRYSGKMKDYALTKANIFLNQKKNDILILNYDNKWREFFLKLKPKSKILFFSLKKLPNHLNGVFVEKNNVIIRNKKEKYIFNCFDFIEKWGKHNLENILISILISDIYHISKEKILDLIKNIPSIKFRQEIVLKRKNLEIYNDTASTSPEAGISAIKRFHNKDNLILITGGTDKDLEYTEWAKILKKYLKKQNVIFLKGTATEKMKKNLKWRNILEFNNLKECFKKALQISKNKNSVILFSPSSKSFEKFKNEFDRGEQFNELVKEILKEK